MDLQERWINDLTEQNKLLAKVIEELESETIGRVQKLEDKLNNAVKSLGEVIILYVCKFAGIEAEIIYFHPSNIFAN